VSRPARLLFHLTVVLAVSAAVLPATAQSIAKADPRALAMGGGYVAVADGWAALQWNPAGMWVSGRNEAAIGFGDAPFEAGPWVDSLRLAAGFPGGVDGATAADTLASPDAGLAGERTVGIYVVSPRFGGHVQQVSYVSEMSRRPPDGLQVQQAALRTREYQFSAAHPFMQGRFALGASVKLVQAQGRLQSVPVQTMTVADLSSRQLLGAARSAPVVADKTVVTVDIGLLVMATARFRFGAVAKNINAPSLDTGTEVFMHLPRQIRIGGMLLPHPDLKLALDVDVYTDSFIDGTRERRELGGGFEWDAQVVALRGGLLLDLNAVEKRATYTFGLGVNGDVLRLDAGGSWAPERDGFGFIGSLAAEF